MSGKSALAGHSAGGEEGAAARLAERLLGLQANREVIPPDPAHSVRWHEHDYPSPIARWNYHPEYEIHLIRHGTGKFIVGDHIGTFEAGHVALIGSGLPHDWVSDLAPGEVIEKRDAVIQFDGHWLERCTALLPELREMAPLLEESSRGIEFLGATARSAAAPIEAMGSSHGIERLGHLMDLFAVLSRAPREDRRYLADAWFNPELDSRGAAVVELVLEYVFTNFASGVSMAEAAEMSGMTQTAFSKYFKRSTGQNFSDLVRKLRIAHARRLLETTDLPVSAVCYDVGFTNLSNFNRHFLRESGMTPRDYRRSRSAPSTA